ncbi:MAG: VWA domain-containing protein [Clostridia bacterium]|nr:VWA domain-containing protein [Clostridia bacterium]
MKNISFDNPYLLFLIIPIALALLVPFFLIRNKDNRSIGWTVSLSIHLVIGVLVTLAAAGLSKTEVLTKTTVYVLADLSYSSERSHDEIDAYINDINSSLPENTELGVVCFGKDCVILTSAGRAVKSVSDAEVDGSVTDIVGALNFTAGLFDDDCIKRIVLITDGNDTKSANASSIASTVETLTESGVKIDAIFLDTSLSEQDSEVQLLEAEYSASVYRGYKNEARFLIRSSAKTDTVLSLYARDITPGAASMPDFKLIGDTVITADSGVTAVRMSLPADEAGTFEYKVTLEGGEDISEYNNTRTFVQRVAGQASVLHVTGSIADEQLIKGIYGENATVDSYVVGINGSVPVNIEELIKYDEIILSSLDLKDVKNANAFIDTVSTVVSQYGKSFITFGNLSLHTDSDNAAYSKLEEILPLDFGSTGVDGRLYTIVLDVSESMFMATKFTIAKKTAIELLSVVEDDDYVCLVTFSGKVNVKLPARAGDVKDELISYINSLTTSHGTDIAMGLEEALSAVKALNLSHNRVMVISDGLSFDSERTALEVATDLYAEGATVSAVNTYINNDGTNGVTILKSIVGAGEGGEYYQISRESDVGSVVFGDIAEDFADVVILKDSAVTLAKPGDDILSGISSLSKVSGYILSLAKYDATVPLSVTYLKANGYQETVPLYAYRSHGNGRVASLATSLSDSWTGLWSEDEKAKFISNLIFSNTPDEKNELPLLVSIERTDYDAYIELVAAEPDPMATASLRLVYPSGRAVNRSLAFDGSKYFFSFDTSDVGVYRLTITYTSGERSYTYETEFELAYLPEYNMFASCDKYNVYEFMRDNGSTSVGEIPDMQTDMSKVSLYKQSYIIPLLIAASVLFIADIVVRKVRIGKKKPKNT